MFIYSIYRSTLSKFSSNRVIAIDDNTLEHLRQWKEIQDKNIPSKYVGLPTNKHAPKHIIDRHSKLANVHCTKTHALRHSHASLLISIEENALIIRDRLEHEDIQTTLGAYGHLYPNTNKDVARKLTNVIQISESNIERKFISNQHVRNHE
ncbi:tyrosine-type recombinase/integrase [Lysinibacillus sp. NPDC056959]|uniref:tyrosine-type recombinase/integrase n=1 Tax=Lysinibacillus sp. NPDC056959 TaxID=3345981 RepID=UPI003631720D